MLWARSEPLLATQHNKDEHVEAVSAEMTILNECTDCKLPD